MKKSERVGAREASGEFDRRETVRDRGKTSDREIAFAPEDDGDVTSIRALRLVAGESAGRHRRRRGVAGGGPAEAELARAADGEAGDRAGDRHRRLLLHRSAIAAAVAGRVPRAPVAVSHDSRPPGCRVSAVRGYRRRLPAAASSCFIRERRGDDAADVR